MSEDINSINWSIALDLTGHKYGKLSVIKPVGKNKHGKVLWLCKCECGNETITSSNSLRRGHTISCGCAHLEKIAKGNPKHGLTNAKLYPVWVMMKDRCMNSNNKEYKNYGGRGVTVCNEWKNNFQAFYDWAMTNGYVEGLSIDRIDNNGNYEPSNCRWATRREQQLNTTRNKRITYNGKTQTLTEWSEELNVRFNKLWERLYKLNWSVERAFTTGGN